ncbi:TonB-dependent receptor [Portibacter lacus]|uniref:TonB-dependent receptor n=1 Tax=Portibacter lacus TaxID=1099794 RepID=A0AA37SQA8_9BACT|nr:TonB-dependent receptor plug domain-containing protein [Portibacter lacus]GLR15650.1 TonB-dependent receptor [Portibacter lacus]
MKNTLLFVFIFVGSLNIHAQKISGIIQNSSGVPIEDAYILHFNHDHHAHTNENGFFSLNEAEIGDTLQIIHLSYKDLFYKISEISDNLKIEMEESSFELGEIVIGENAKKTNLISYIDNQTTTVNSSQEILRKVPGLFIGQHAGGGKAEQIFLRGFDIDHGTDIALAVDGMPVNMVSHAHGQGYSDLHFLIPETIELIDFGKGPYYADEGNFATAGYVGFKTKDEIANSQVNIELGQFNTLRTSGIFNVLNQNNHDAYIATQYMISDGPFESPQNFSRVNFFGKYTGRTSSKDKFSVIASHFQSEWDASGQIPVRAVEQGLISRFGAIDDTEGGNTRRTNLQFTYSKTLDDHSYIRNHVYYSEYDFELFSNFTFFLEDPVNGDQIRQYEDRQLFGFESVWNHEKNLNFANSLVRAGIGYRNDLSKDNRLSKTLNRKETLEDIQFGDINEKNVFSFVSGELEFDRLSVQAALRWDYFNFNYESKLSTLFDRKVQDKSVFSPKLNFIYNLNRSVQLYWKSGIGFHSNDTRIVLEQQVEDALPKVYGTDVGVAFKPFKRMFVDVALWYLFLEQEFVYVGDAGIVEPSGKTGRAGVDLGVRYQILDELYFSGDFNYTYARSLAESDGENLIPLAPPMTSTAGLYYKKGKFNASYKSRFIKDRPANENGSIIADGYFISDVNANYTFGNINIGFAIENLFNQEWNEAQFATESRLINEVNPVEEIHFTPGTPFFAKAILKFNF